MQLYYILFPPKINKKHLEESDKIEVNYDNVKNKIFFLSLTLIIFV